MKEVREIQADAIEMMVDAYVDRKYGSANEADRKFYSDLSARAIEVRDSADLESAFEDFRTELTEAEFQSNWFGNKVRGAIVDAIEIMAACLNEARV